MNILVDTSVWSLALRRDITPDIPEVHLLSRCLQRQDTLFTTGLIVQELLQGFHGPKHRERIIEHFSSFHVIVPDLQDHIGAAALRATCRRRGIQVGTIDVLIAQLAIGRDLELLTTDHDYVHMARHAPLRILSESS